MLENENIVDQYSAFKSSFNNKDYEYINLLLKNSNIQDKEKQLKKYLQKKFTLIINAVDKVELLNNKIETANSIISIFSEYPMKGEKLFHIIVGYFAKKYKKPENQQQTEKYQLCYNKTYIYNCLNEDGFIVIPTEKGQILIYLAYLSKFCLLGEETNGKFAYLHSQVIKESDKVFYIKGDSQSYIELLGTKSGTKLKELEYDFDTNQRNIEMIEEELNTIYSQNLNLQKHQQIAIGNNPKMNKILFKYIMESTPFAENLKSYVFKQNKNYKILFEIPGFEIDCRKLKVDTCVIEKNLYVYVTYDQKDNILTFPVIKIENHNQLVKEDKEYKKGFLTITLKMP